MKFQQQLKYYRERRAMNKTEVAHKLNVTLTYYTELENGRKRPPTLERCREIAKIFNLSPTETERLIDAAMEERIKPEMTEWLEHKTKVQLIPVISWIHANQFSHIEDHFPVGISDEFVPTTEKGENIFSLIVKNDCMFNPQGKISFAEGDRIIVNPHLHADSGDFVIVRDSKSQEATFKQFIKRGKKVILHPLNPKYSDIELDHDQRYEIIGKVVGKYTKIGKGIS